MVEIEIALLSSISVSIFLALGNILSMIVHQMTVLASENTVKFFALNLTACDIISLVWKQQKATLP